LKKIIFIIVIIAVGWYGNYYFGHNGYDRQFAMTENANYAHEDSNIHVASSGNQFRCDGRIYCSQMTSCEEATFFIRNFPGTKIDGNKDGVPCENNGADSK
jgi:hypothetical protein